MRRTDRLSPLGGSALGAAAAAAIVMALAVLLVGGGGSNTTVRDPVAVPTSGPPEIVVGSVPSVSSIPSTLPLSNPPLTLDGEAIYGAECASCHENGYDEDAPSLQGLTRPIADVVLVITNGSGTMSGFSETLTPEQIDAVAGYVLEDEGR